MATESEHSEEQTDGSGWFFGCLVFVFVFKVNDLINGACISQKALDFSYLLAIQDHMGPRDFDVLT